MAEDDNRDSITANPAQLRRLRTLARVLDTAIGLPGGYRIGFDGILGLLPGFGDTVGALLASYIVVEASRLGVSTAVLMRMIFNVLLEAIVGVIPVLGDLFDFAWKANQRNLQLLEAQLGKPAHWKGSTRRVGWVVIGILVVMFALILALSLLILRALVTLVS